MLTNERLLILTTDREVYDAVKYVKPLLKYEVSVQDYTAAIQTEEQYAQLLGQFDKVLFADAGSNARSSALAEKRIFPAINAGKNVICAIPFEPGKIDEMKKASSHKNVSFLYSAEPYSHAEKGLNVKIESSRIKTINTPVIFVAGVSEGTQKFYIQLALRQKFITRGYHVSQIGTKNYCEIFGFHSIPSFLSSSDLSELSKIILLNHFVKKIELTEKPDVIIIGVPGGLFPLDSEFHNKFGITAFEMSQAVCPDAVVLSTLYEDFTREYFEEINLTMKYRFGYEADCFNISDLKFDWAEAQVSHKPCYMTIDPVLVSKKKTECSIPGKPVFHILDDADAEQMTEYVIDKLSEYAMTGIVD